NRLLTLAVSVKALSDRADPAISTAAAAALVQRALDLLDGREQPLQTFLASIRLLADKVDRKSTPTLVQHALDRACTTEDPLAMNALWQAQAILPAAGDPASTAPYCRLLVQILSVKHFHAVQFPDELFRSVLRRVSARDAVDLLEHPFCIGK